MSYMKSRLLPKGLINSNANPVPFFAFKEILEACRPLVQPLPPVTVSFSCQLGINLESPGMRKPQVQNCLHQTRLWACLYGTLLIANQCRKTQSTTGRATPARWGQARPESYLSKPAGSSPKFLAWRSCLALLGR